MRKIIVAIDGHSSCGKSTLAREIADEFDYVYIDSGAMYRAVTLYLLENHIPIDNLYEIEQALPDINIRFIKNADSSQDIILNEVKRNKEIRGRAVSSAVSPVATISSVRKFLVDQQRLFGQEKAIVMDGRDIGSVVFPEAELKLFLTANIAIRSQRRYLELLHKGLPLSIEDVQKNLIERDGIDSSRKDSPLIIADHAVVLDNSYLTKIEQFEMIKSLVTQRIKTI